MAKQKGMDLLFETLPNALAARDFGCVALGSGDARYEDFFSELQHDFPGRVHFHRGYSDELAHWIEAASDLFLMPSLYEPCGLNQLYSMRYGTVPLVRNTGGLADSVQQYDASTKRGTGFVFDAFTPEAFATALDAALTLYTDQTHWRQLARNGMRQDFSWQQQGKLYLDLYEQLLA
jgi:starch synthase